MIDLEILKPTIYRIKATGFEKNLCELCNISFSKNEDVVELLKSVYKGKFSYAKRFHLKCFLKIIAFNFSEIFDEELKREVLLNKMGGE